MSVELIAAGVRLADALEQENAALAALDLRGAAAMLDTKQQALAAFTAAGLHPGSATRANADLLALAWRLDAAAAANRQLLERGIAVQSRVLAVIAGAAPRARAPRYGAGGRIAAPRAPLALCLRA